EDELDPLIKQRVELDMNPAMIPDLDEIERHAAFLGAWFAFYLQDQKEKRKEIDHHVILGNEVIAALVDNVNILHLIQQGHIEPFRDDPHYWLRILPLPYNLEPNVEVNIQNLSFLWQKGNANLTSMVSKEKLNFKLTLKLINNRSEYHADVVQPIFNSMGFHQGSKIEYKEIQENLGPKILATMSGLTNDMINAIDDTIKSHKVVISALYDEISRIYPGKKVLRIEYVEPQTNEPNKAERE
ncbi:MAG: hypothetical protein AB2559_21040, partial [Candidatus Thiodiazotropha endolucinida]